MGTKVWVVIEYDYNPTWEESRFIGVFGDRKSAIYAAETHSEDEFRIAFSETSHIRHAESCTRHFHIFEKEVVRCT